MLSTLPPYYQNFDDSHCSQCTLRGILEYFEPKATWTWEELDRFTDKEPDKWTWQYRGQINMTERGYDVFAINSEDVDTFMRDGIYETFVVQLGIEAADQIRIHSNLEAANEDMVRFQDLVKQGAIHHELRIPTIEDMKSFLDKGYLLDCSLNSRKLRDEEGYSSHMVLVYGIDDAHVYFHDSSIAHGGAGLKTSIEKFIAACTSPEPEQWAITAYKKKII